MTVLADQPLNIYQRQVPLDKTITNSTCDAVTESRRKTRATRVLDLLELEIYNKFSLQSNRPSQWKDLRTRHRGVAGDKHRRPFLIKIRMTVNGSRSVTTARCNYCYRTTRLRHYPRLEDFLILKSEDPNFGSTAAFVIIRLFKIAWLAVSSND